jgi:hypothetical protein
MLSVAVLELGNIALDAAGAVYVVLRPEGMLAPCDDVQVAVALAAPLSMYALRAEVDPFASSTLGFGLLTLMVS